MTSSSESRYSIICRPWKVLRILVRFVLLGTLAWLLLALFWAFLPSPNPETDGDNRVAYATSVLRFGNTLTRVYDSKILRTPHLRNGFALDYKIDIDNLTLLIGESALPIVPEFDVLGSGNINLDPIAARIGDIDGANLPWFTFADSVLLFWWIHKEEMSLPLVAQYHDVQGGTRKLDVRLKSYRGSDPSNALLSIEIDGTDASTLVVNAPEMPISSSPSSTYTLRVAIIQVIAPIAVFMNNFIGNALGVIIKSLVAALYFGLIILLCGVTALTVVSSLWRCFRGRLSWAPLGESRVDWRG